MTKWTPAGDEVPMSEARETMDAMVESYHPTTQVWKWRELADYAAARAKEVQRRNEQQGVPEQ
jgi:hypothetical protein